MSRTVGLILLACAVAQAKDGRTIRFKAKRIEAAAPFPTQRTDLHVFRPVGDAVRLDGRVFGVRPRKGGGLVVAVKPDAKPSKGLRRAATLRLGGTPVRFRRGRAGWECAVLDAREFEVDRVEVRLIDADGNGRFEIGSDACRLPPSPFVFPLDAELVVGRKRLRIERLAPDGREIEASVSALYGTDRQLDALVRVNLLRAGVGLPPTIVDEALSDACSKHSRYLRIIKWHPAKGNPHFEVKGRRGYSDEGHRAGMMSVISWSSHASAIPAYWQTHYHRFAFLHPLVGGIGISDGTPSVSVIDGKSRSPFADVAPEGWRDPVLVPADGQVDTPSGFHRGGEIPSPVENEGSRGFPLTVLFLARDPAVTGFSGRLVRIGKRGEEHEISTLVPKGRGSRNRFGLIPERPLRSGLFRATYLFARRGKAEEAVATFRVE